MFLWYTMKNPEIEIERPRKRENPDKSRFTLDRVHAGHKTNIYITPACSKRNLIFPPKNKAFMSQSVPMAAGFVALGILQAYSARSRGKWETAH